jgi:hypothetical protein
MGSKLLQLTYSYETMNRYASDKPTGGKEFLNSTL